MSFLSQLFPSKKSNIHQISANALKQLLQSDANIKVLDVRTAREYKHGHISKSFNIDVFSSNFVSQCQSKLSSEDKIIVCCRSGQRSSNATKKLEKAGFNSLYNLKGGLMAWSKV